MLAKLLETTFDLVWWIGFLGAIFIIILATFNILENTYFILIYSIAHMIILSIFGIKGIDNGESNIDIGHRISTMGYLHTLIGTTIALILSQIDSSSLDILSQMNLLIIPIASAMITSIIGWAIGTEIERNKYNNEEEIAVDNLYKNIDNLGKKLTDSATKWEGAIDTNINSLFTSVKNLEEKYEDILSKSSKKFDEGSTILMNKYLKSFDNLFEKLEKQIQVIDTKFDNTSDKSIKIMDNLMLNFKKIFKEIESQSQTISSDFEISTNNMNKTIEELSKIYTTLLNDSKINIKQIEDNLNNSTNISKKAIDDFTEELKKLFDIMEKYSVNMQSNFKDSTNNAKDMMDELSCSFKTSFTLVGNMSQEWEQHIEDMKNFSENSKGSLEGLLNNSLRISKEIEAVANGLPQSARILREVDDIIEILRVIKEDDNP